MSARCQVAERRPAQHQFGLAEADEIGQVGGAVGKLQDLEASVGIEHVGGQIGAQVILNAGPVEILSWTHRREFRQRLVGERIEFGWLQRCVLPLRAEEWRTRRRLSPASRGKARPLPSLLSARPQDGALWSFLGWRAVQNM